nr:MAG TPA: hypothetical protein [Bacteriophage sp.]
MIIKQHLSFQCETSYQKCTETVRTNSFRELPYPYLLSITFFGKN